MPTTTMPSMEKLISMARKFPQVRKCGEANVMAMHSASMIAISPASRIDPRRSQLRPASPGALALISASMRVPPVCLSDILNLPCV